MDSIKLEDHGIVPLTGEACAYSLRVLCDVTEHGKTLLEKYFGVDKIDLAPNWNNQTNGKPHIGSITIGRRSFTDIKIFCGLQSNEVVMVEPSETVVTMTKAELEYLRADFPSHLEKACIYYNPGFDRNQHQMSGRTY